MQLPMAGIRPTCNRPGLLQWVDILACMLWMSEVGFRPARNGPVGCLDNYDIITYAYFELKGQTLIGRCSFGGCWPI